MKKLYIQPVTEAATMMSQSIICVSAGLGGSSNNIVSEDTYIYVP